MKLLFPGNNAMLEIDVMSYQHPNSTNFYDLNWLYCRAMCQINSLKVTEFLSLLTTDFVELQESIYAFQEHKSDIVEFQTLEEQLNFTIRREKTTHIVIEGKISAMTTNRGVFNFKFDAEALLFSTIESLENIMLNFPIIQGVE